MASMTSDSSRLRFGEELRIAIDGKDCHWRGTKQSGGHAQSARPPAIQICTLSPFSSVALV